MKILYWLVLIIPGFILGAILGFLAMFPICSILGDYCGWGILYTMPIGAIFGAVALLLLFITLKKLWLGSDYNRAERIQREKEILSALLSSPAKQKPKRKRAN